MVLRTLVCAPFNHLTLLQAPEYVTESRIVVFFQCNQRFEILTALLLQIVSPLGY